jgi:hypothetical protein
MAEIKRTQLPKCLQDMSRKQKAYIYVMHSSTYELHGTYWDEGSKYDYTLVNLKTGERRRCVGQPNPFVCKTPIVTIESGWVLVCTGICQGKVSTMSVRVAVPAMNSQTPNGIVADWLDDSGRTEEADLVRLVA